VSKKEITSCCNLAVLPEGKASDIMRPENDVTDSTRRKAGQNRRWYKPIRCSICTSFIWFRPIVLKEQIGAPEPLQEWILCKPCHVALLVEMRRSTIRSSVHLRIAIGLVAAERSPTTYHLSRQQQVFQREFAWAMRLMILFALLHLVILLILLVAPK
jgi:hypothetical protein